MIVENYFYRCSKEYIDASGTHLYNEIVDFTQTNKPIIESFIGAEDGKKNIQQLMRISKEKMLNKT